MESLHSGADPGWAARGSPWAPGGPLLPGLLFPASLSSPQTTETRELLLGARAEQADCLVGEQMNEGMSE